MNKQSHIMIINKQSHITGSNRMIDKQSHIMNRIINKQSDIKES